MREPGDIGRLRRAYDQLRGAESALRLARFEASAALGCAIEAECLRRQETRTQFAERHGVSKAHVTDMLYGRRYSQKVVDALITRAGAGEG